MLVEVGTGRLIKPFIQPFKLRLLQILRNIRVDVQRRRYICVPQRILNHLNIGRSAALQSLVILRIALVEYSGL